MQERLTPEPRSAKRPPERERSVPSIREQLRQGLYLMVLEPYTGDNAWTLERVARDIWQNFVDANQNTADGLRVDVSEAGERGATVMIHGQAEYPFSRLLSFGGGHKEEAEKAAGGKSEGTRILALTLLRDHGVQAVVYASGSWRLTFYLDDPPRETIDEKTQGIKGLYVRLEDLSPEEAVEGNYIKIDVPDPALAEACVKARDLFRHSHNPDFLSPDVETVKGGFRILPAGQRGNFYLNGQRISVGEKERWNTVSRFHLWSKQRPEFAGQKLNPGRDREVITEHDIEDIFVPFLVDSMSKPELEHTLRVLEEFYEMRAYHEESRLGQRLLKEVIASLARKGHRQVFNSKDVACDVGRDDQEMLRALGCRPCLAELARIGMIKASDFYKELQDLARVEPGSEQRERMRLVEGLATQFVQTLHRDIPEARRALEALLATGKSEPVGARPESRGREDIEVKPIAVFRKRHPHVDGKYDDAVYWISEDALRMSSPYRMMAIYLHEMCHKFGSDQSAEFSYVLTTVMERWSQFLVEHPQAFLTFAQAWEATPVTEVWRTVAEAEAKLEPLVASLATERRSTDERPTWEERQVEQRLIEIVEQTFEGRYTAATGQELFHAANAHPAMVDLRQFWERLPHGEEKKQFDAEVERQLAQIRIKEAKARRLHEQIREEEGKIGTVGSSRTAKRTRSVAASAKIGYEAAMQPIELEIKRMYAELRAYEQQYSDPQDLARLLAEVRDGSFYDRTIDLEAVGDLRRFGPQYLRLLAEFLADDQGDETAEREWRAWLEFMQTHLEGNAWRVSLLREARRLLAKLKQQATPRELRYAQLLYEALMTEGSGVKE